MTPKNIDQEIKKRVQAIETEIPVELEKNIMKELGQANASLVVPRLQRRLFRRPLAAAATVLLGVLLLVTAFSFLFRQKPDNGGKNPQEGVIIDAAWVEGRPVDTFIIDQKDPDITIVWFEKQR